MVKNMSKVRPNGFFQASVDRVSSDWAGNEMSVLSRGESAEMNVNER